MAPTSYQSQQFQRPRRPLPLGKPGYFERKDQSIWTQVALSATIQDAEGVIIDQLIDLSRIRTRDDLVEYDRFVYVGRLELSASAEARRKKYGAGVSFLSDLMKRVSSTDIFID